MHAICPECKNTIDLSTHGASAKGDIIECSFCGMTLCIGDSEGDTVTLDIVDEGK